MDRGTNDLTRLFNGVSDLLFHARSGHALYLCYDERGSAFWTSFSEKSPDYYIFRNEEQLIERENSAIADIILNDPDMDRDNLIIIELGPGPEAAVQGKTIPVLSHFPAGSIYVPVEWSESYLNGAHQIVGRACPDIRIVPRLMDFNRNALELTPEELQGLENDRPRIVFMFGSSISNIPGAPHDPLPIAAIKGRLEHYKSYCGRNGYLLLSYDANHDRSSIEKSYDHPAHAEFSRNLFFRAKDLLSISTNFNPDLFLYKPIWHAENHVLCHTLIATAAQKIDFSGRSKAIQKNEEFVYSNSYKYLVELFRSIAGEVGLETKAVLYDSQERIVLHLLKNTSQSHLVSAL